MESGSDCLELADTSVKNNMRHGWISVKTIDWDHYRILSREALALYAIACIVTVQDVQFLDLRKGSISRWPELFVPAYVYLCGTKLPKVCIAEKNGGICTKNSRFYWVIVRKGAIKD